MGAESYKAIVQLQNKYDCNHVAADRIYELEVIVHLMSTEIADRRSGRVWFWRSRQPNITPAEIKTEYETLIGAKEEALKERGMKDEN